MIHFCSNKKIILGIYLVIFIAGIIAMLINGVQLDIQFKGGSIIKYEYTGEINTEESASVISSALGRAASCQSTIDTVTDKKFLVINLAGNEGLSSAQQELLIEKLAEKYPDGGLSLYESSTVEPFIGQKFLRNGILAVILAFILMVLYVGYRFRKIGGFSAGIMAIVALLFDCAVAFFAFVIFKYSINENFIAVVLTIIGYSVNATIVIYDRIRENTLLSKKGTDIEELVNKSITQTLARSINTSLTTAISMIIICIFAKIYGISSIMSFALPMTFGVISGCLSSVCLASPLWVAWKKYTAAA